MGRFNNTLHILLSIFIDFMVLILSLVLAIFLHVSFFKDMIPIFDLSIVNEYYWITIITIALLLYEKIYFIRYDFWTDMKNILKGVFLSFIVSFIILIFSKMSNEYSISFILGFFLISSFLLPFFKRITKKIFFRKLKLFHKRVKIVGNSSQYDEILQEIENNWYLGLKPCKKRFDMVLISSKDFEIDRLQRRIKLYSKKTKDVYIIPYMYHLNFSSENIVDYFNIRLSAIHIENKLLNYKNIFIKYIFEKCTTIFIFPFALFIHLFISIFIKLDSKGKIFFKQRRLGINGKTFNVYKYRTMYENGDEILEKYLKENPKEIEYYSIYHKYQNDPRITKLGKFLRASSLDEFPQFYNVLRGDMNLIGPRPYMLDEKIKIGKFNEDLILKVKPGITGLWQVSGRNELSFSQRIDLDKWYIKNWSLWIDFVIFLKTIKVILTKVGAR